MTALSTIPATYRDGISAFRLLCKIAGVPVTKDRYAAVLEGLRSGKPSAGRMEALEHRAAIAEAQVDLLKESLARQSLALLESAGGHGTAQSAVLMEAMARLTGTVRVPAPQVHNVIHIPEEYRPIVNVNVPEQRMPEQPIIVNVPEQRQPAVNVNLPEMVVNVPSAPAPVIRNVIEAAESPEIVVNVSPTPVSVTPEITLKVPPTRKVVHRDKDKRITEITETVDE